jgi:hypothetical protein
MSDDNANAGGTCDADDAGIAQADSDQQSFCSSNVGHLVSTCGRDKYLVVVPRKPANIFDCEMCVKPLLPDRYPGGKRIKQIEYNYYPDLNVTRTVSAIVTSEAWEPKTDMRPEPLSGVPVYFVLGSQTTAKCKLSSNQPSTDGNGVASVQVTIQKLLSEREEIQAAACVEVIASLSPSCSPGDPEVLFTIHRNEDVDDTLGAAEAPGDFASALAPVLSLKTWLVRQKSHFVTSNGAKALQQLINQVACRKKGDHQFVKPDGQFGPGVAGEVKKFLSSFSTKPAGDAQSDYRGCKFGVAIEDDSNAQQGVKTYVNAEYGSYDPGTVVDAYILAGKAQWTAGGNVMDADGLLDIYTSVVWEYLEAGRERAAQYANAAVSWYRHPNDNGPTPHWPDTVSVGVAYWYGGARKLEDFQADLVANFATPPASAQSWFQYLHDNNCRIGVHQGNSDNQVDVPTDLYNQFAHLQNDPDISNTASPDDPPNYVLSQSSAQDSVKRQYTGIDCSGFCQRVAIEALFRSTHCGDLAGERICTTVSDVPYVNGPAQNRLSTTTFPNQYREIANAQWRTSVTFRGDVLNRPGHHIVMLETADRGSLDTDSPAVGGIWVYQACGDTTVAAVVQAIWPQTECPRRVVYSPLGQWGTAWDAWQNSTTNVHFGRVYLWA